MTNNVQPIEQRLRDFFDSHLPVMGFMKVCVDYYDGKTLRLSSPLAPNINDKLTAFGGSLFCLNVMTCWGMQYLQTLEADIDCNSVVSHAEIDYIRPVRGERFVAECSIDEAVASEMIDNFKNNAKSVVSLSSSISENGKVCVSFSGRYALLPLLK